MMKRAVQLLFFVVCGLAASALAHETRFFEAEHMEMRGFSVGSNPAAGYSGHGEFALFYQRLPEGEKIQRPKELALSARISPPLPPGEYRVILHYIDPCRVRVRIGGGSAEQELGLGKRYESISVLAIEPADQFLLEVLECETRVIFDWVFITNDPTHQLKRSKERHWLEKVRPPPSPPVAPDAPNQIANGSFEAGLPVGWSTPYQGNMALFSSMLDATHHVHGRYSLRVPLTRLSRSPNAYNSSTMSYGPIPIPRGEVRHLTLWARSEPEARVGMMAELVGSRISWQTMRALDEKWQKIWLKVGPAEKDGLVNLVLRLEGNGPGHVWVDAVCFGAEDSFLPPAPIEAGPIWTRPANIMLAGRDEAKLAIWREPNAKKEAQFEYKVFDLSDLLVMERTLDLSSAPEGGSSLPMPLPDKQLGVYRMHFRTLGERSSPWQQVCFCVVPDTSAIRDAPIGIYGSFAPQALEIYELLGFRTTCTLSAGGQIGSWYLMEPVFGKGYYFFDEDVENAARHNIRVLANLHTVPYAWPYGVPLFRTAPEEPFVQHREKGYLLLSAWRSFVTAVANHYKGRIRDWLIIDEPSSQYVASEYLKLLQVSYEELKRADPENRVFMHSHIAANRTYLEELDKLGAAQYCDALYDYVRTKEAAEKLAAWCEKYKKPLWTVEYGGFHALYQEDVSSVENPFSLPARDNVEMALLSALRSLAWPRAERYFRYDARFPGHFGQMTMFHHDGTIKPGGVALALLNSKLAGLRPVGEMQLPSPLQGFLFTSSERSLIALRHAQEGALLITAQLDPKRIEVCDVMGRRIELSDEGGVRFVVDRQFKYITLSASDLPVVQTAFEGCRKVPTATVKASFLRASGQPLALRIELTNQMEGDFEGFICPSSASLFHLAGYTPFREENSSLQRTLRRKLRLPPGGTGAVEFILNYPDTKRFRPKGGSSIFGLVIEGSGVSQVLRVRLDAIE